MSDILSVEPGSKVFTSLPAFELADGSDLRFPVIVVRGIKDGPKLYVGAGMHGDEHPPVAAIGELAQRIDPSKLSGMLIGVPVENPLGFRAKRDFPPPDWRRDMYNSFPGNPRGGTSQMMAHVLYSNLISKMNYVIDLHTMGDYGDMLPQTYFAPLNLGNAAHKGKELAEIFGAEQYNEEYDGHDGYLHVVLAKNNIPAVVVELPRNLNEAITTGVKGIQNIMIHLGMLDGTIEGSKSKILIKGPPERPILTATKAGILIYVAKLGDKLSRGTPIARIVDIYGREVEVVRSPVDGLLQTISINPTIEPGGRVCRIGIPA